MIHPHSICKEVNDVVGLGVYATENIPKGTITWIFDELDICIENEVFENSSPETKSYIDKYSYIANDKKTRILNWDHSRYMNHCCHANTLCTPYNFDIAIRDIKKGEQITCDYRMFCDDDEDDAGLDLLCDQKECAKILKFKTTSQLRTHWREKIENALTEWEKVPQLLLNAPSMRQRVLDYYSCGK